MKRLLILFLLTGCESSEIEKAIHSEYSMECAGLGYLYRCENKEVVCYQSFDSRGGVDCKWKDGE